MAPVTPAERIVSLDVLRGLALYGVLLINLLDGFRVSLFAYLTKFHTEPGRCNRLVDVVVALLVEQKAMVVFSFLFGVGLGIVSERAQVRGVALVPFLLRRYGILLGIGLVHLLLVWDGDILTEYAVAALCVTPLVRLRPRTRAFLGVALLLWWASPHPPPSMGFPSEVTMARLAERAARSYGGGSWADVLAFRRDELQTGILPLLVSVLPRTVGLFLLGAAASSVVRHPPRRVVLALAAIGLPVGGALATLDVLVAEGALRLGDLRGTVGNVSTLLMGLGYVGAFAFAFEWAPLRKLLLRLAPIGRMALTSYLIQSFVCIALFYGVGLGLMNRIGSAVGLLIATGIFILQVWASTWWLARRSFGPIELLWRRLTYGDRLVG